MLVVISLLDFSYTRTQTSREATSTTVLPLAEPLTIRFMELNPELRVEPKGMVQRLESSNAAQVVQMAVPKAQR